MDDEIRPMTPQPLIANDFMELDHINRLDRDIEHLPAPRPAHRLPGPVDDAERKAFFLLMKKMDELEGKK